MTRKWIKKENALLFENETGLQLELTYHKNGAWRLRADAACGTSFDCAGDAQELAAYLGEKSADTASGFDACAQEDGIVFSTADGYTARLNTKDAFSLSFYAKDGKKLTEVTEVTLHEGSMHLTGTLNEGDAVFGGGQRFDKCNRRGTTMRLFSYDAYNTDGGKATYMPIPLFYTASGGGMFFNHYERMQITFGDLTDNTWHLEICKDALDAYFYTEGSYASLLRSYSDLTGYAVATPAEWMQGVLICRYSPDFTELEPQQYIFNTFEELPDRDQLLMDGAEKLPARPAVPADGKGPVYYVNGKTGLRHYAYFDGTYYRISKKGNPQGAGIQHVVETLTAVGQKPTAMVLEGGFYCWRNSTEDTEKARANRKLLKDTVRWLHDRDIRVMLYTSISSIDSVMKGYKPEYQLWMDVTDAKGNVTHTHRIPEQKVSDNPDVTLGGRAYLDMTNPAAVDWYMDTLWEDLIDLGIDGIKIDFCEMLPEEGSYDICNKEKEVIDTVTLKYCFHNPAMFTGMNAHHALPTYFISLFCKKMNEKIAKREDGNGFMVLSRGGAFGSQRNPYLWAGDQTRVFENLSTQLTAILSSGLSGVPFMTYDMAGYGYPRSGGYFLDGMKETESEIYARAIEYTAFTTCIQTHGDVRHLYELTEETQSIARLYTALHQKLLPYIQRLTKEACLTGMPPVRHLILGAPQDTNVYDINDEFTLGDALLVAPILTKGTYQREVYVPAGNWKNLLTGEHLTGARHVTVKASLAQIPLFLNLDSADAPALAAILDGILQKGILTL